MFFFFFFLKKCWLRIAGLPGFWYLISWRHSPCFRFDDPTRSESTRPVRSLVNKFSYLVAYLCSSFSFKFSQSLTTNQVFFFFFFFNLFIHKFCCCVFAFKIRINGFLFLFIYSIIIFFFFWIFRFWTIRFYRPFDPLCVDH